MVSATKIPDMMPIKKKRKRKRIEVKVTMQVNTMTSVVAIVTAQLATTVAEMTQMRREGCMTRGKKGRKEAADGPPPPGR